MNDPQIIEPYPPRILMTTETPLRGITPLADLKPGVKNLNCSFVILEKSMTRMAANGHSHCQFKVADESASINLTLWDQAAEYLQPGDVCSLKSGSTSVYKGSMSLNCGKNSEVLKVGRIVHPISLQPDMSVYNEEYDRLFTNSNKSTDEVEASKRNNVITGVGRKID